MRELVQANHLYEFYQLKGLKIVILGKSELKARVFATTMRGRSWRNAVKPYITSY